MFNLFVRYIIFIAGGFIGWLALIGVYTYFSEQFHPVISYGFGIIFDDIITFMYHRHITFRIKSRVVQRFVLFTILILFISFLNWSLFSVGKAILKLPVKDWLLSIVITSLLSVLNFTFNRLIIFGKA